MKILIKYSFIILLLTGFVIILHSCKKEELPTLSTASITNISATSATSGGNITSDGGAEITARGICWSTNANPTTSDSKTNDGTGQGQYVSELTGLTSGTIYHIRAYATNSTGTAYGGDMTFTTRAVVALITNSIIEVTYNSALGGGNITNDGEYAIIARGICWSTSPNPTINDEHTIDGAGVGNFTRAIKCLEGETTYYVRAYATNSGGTFYGNQESFTTDPSPITFNPELTYGTVMDIDGNCYKTIQIGNQVWMAENLRTTRYNDGNPIPNVTNDVEWANIPTAAWVGTELPLTYVTYGAYCWYNNETDIYGNDYGILYNWGAVGTDKLCPTGWHVPSLEEWRVICPETDYENGPYGEELMETGKIHWNESAELVGINTTGLTALPGGNRQFTGGFNYSGYKGFYWASNGRMYPGLKFAWNIYYSGRITTPSAVLESEKEGRSVRCIKDQ